MTKTKEPKTRERRSTTRINKAKVAAAQKNLEDGEGAFAATAHDRYKNVDSVARKFFAARDEAAIQEQKRKDALELMQKRLTEHGHEGPYFVDHGGGKYKLELLSKEQLSVAKCKKAELEN